MEELDRLAWALWAVPEGRKAVLLAAIAVHPPVQPLAREVSEQPEVDLTGPQGAVRGEQVLGLYFLASTKIISLGRRPI